jgi:hypothetical protein
LEVAPTDSVKAAELAREIELCQWAQRLAEIDQTVINPVVKQRLADALRDAAKLLAAMAEQFESDQTLRVAA